MIKLCEDCEFTTIFADFIEVLAGENSFTVKIWVNGSEIPFEYDHTAEFFFLQEGLRVTYDDKVDWLFYDTIVSMRVLK